MNIGINKTHSCEAVLSDKLILITHSICLLLQLNTRCIFYCGHSIFIYLLPSVLICPPQEHQMLISVYATLAVSSHFQTFRAHILYPVRFSMNTLCMSSQTNGCPYSRGTTLSGRSSTSGSCTEDVCTPCACSHLHISHCCVVIDVTDCLIYKNG
jgi:hypothetical protein